MLLVGRTYAYWHRLASGIVALALVACAEPSMPAKASGVQSGGGASEQPRKAESDAVEEPSSERKALVTAATTRALDERELEFLEATLAWQGDIPEGWAECVTPAISLPVSGPFIHGNYSNELSQIVRSFEGYEFAESVPIEGLRLHWDVQAKPTEPMLVRCGAPLACERFAEILRTVLEVMPELVCDPPRSSNKAERDRRDYATSPGICERIRACQLRQNYAPLSSCQQINQLPDWCHKQPTCEGVVKCHQESIKNYKVPRDLVPRSPPPPPELLRRPDDKGAE